MTVQKKKKTTKKDTTEHFDEQPTMTPENVVESPTMTTENVDDQPNMTTETVVEQLIMTTEDVLKQSIIKPETVVEQTIITNETSVVEEMFISSDKVIENTYTNETENIEKKNSGLEKSQSLDEVLIVREVKEQIKEVIKEKIDEVITIKVEHNLVDIVKEEIRQKTYILNKEYIDILNSLVNLSPLLLNDIETAIFEIVKDGKIDSNDIPYLITIIQKLYKFIFSLKIRKLTTEKRCAYCAEIIKFIVNVLIKERRIKVEPSKQEDFLIKFNALMESCILLLNLQSSLLSKGCLSWLFGKK